jgi:erythromycin esterase-like protein
MFVRVLGWLLLSLSACSATAATMDIGPVVRQATAQLCDKRVAVLAELPSHGEARAFTIKAEIAKALVQRCGFKALLFEAPIYDFVGMESLWGKGSATPRQLDNAIGKFWWARELEDWRGWLFQQADQGGLILGGIDDQVSITSAYARANLPALTAGLLDRRSARKCRAMVERNLTWSYDATHPFDSAEQERLRVCARAAALATLRPAGLGPLRGEQAMSINLASYVDRQIAPDSARDRDEVMFRNTQWYLARMPTGTKTIIWTATVHGAKQQGERKAAPLGTLLTASLGAEVGVVGFTAREGQSSMAGSPAKALGLAPTDSLERRALHPGEDLVYLDSSALAALGVVESRLLGKFSHADWSTRFDGVVVIAEEIPASFQAQP